MTSDSVVGRTPARELPGAAVNRRRTLRALLASMRPRQWIKNCVIFAALIFSQTLTDVEHLWRAAVAFLLFCAVSSAVYILNDIMDVERDRLHPVKSRRPLPAGELGATLAGAVGVGLAATALLLAFWLSPTFALLTVVYLASNVLYSVWLKEVVIVDVMVVAGGYLIRAVAGGVVIDVDVSAWLVLCTILLSLFLAFAKRRQELAQLEAHAMSHRATLGEYSVAFLDQMIAIVTAATVVAYFLYALAPETRERLGTPYLPLTIPFVLYGLFRYLYLVHQRNMGESPTGAFYADWPLFANAVLWALTVVAILYLT